LEAVGNLRLWTVVLAQVKSLNAGDHPRALNLGAQGVVIGEPSLQGGRGHCHRGQTGKARLSPGLCLPRLDLGVLPAHLGPAARFLRMVAACNASPANAIRACGRPGHAREWM
jgi:hypothetical protein